MYLTLGFDAKNTRAYSWDMSRRNIFLLNKNCLLPKSVDDSVWSSVLDNDEKPNQINAIFQDYYVNLAELEQASTGTDSIITAVSLELDSCSNASLSEWNRYLFGKQEDALLDDERINIPPVCVPSIMPSEFEFIGYDIADFWGLSGLMNCAVNDGMDDNQEANKITPLLNEHHLFESFEKANEYALYLNELVKEHAPFFVYSLRVKSNKSKIR